MTAAKHALRYLRGTTDLPIVYKRGQFRMVPYTDASSGANPDNCKSTTGYLFFLGGGLISFGSKTQSLTAQSTVKSELQALSDGAREAVYLSSFLMELGFKTFSSVQHRSTERGGKRYVQLQNQAHRSPVLLRTGAHQEEQDHSLP